MTTIKATYTEPSKKCLWLVELTGVNRQKFCGKRGTILESCKQDYIRVKSSVDERRFTIASIDDVKDEDANFTYKRIKKLTMSADDISYQFSFGFGNEIYAETLQGLKKKIQEKLKYCAKHIKRAQKSEGKIMDLYKEFTEWGQIENAKRRNN